MKRSMIALCLIALALPVLAAGSHELTLSGSASKPNDGHTVWALTGEVLVPVGPFVLGPSFSLFDSGPVDGNSFGLAGELNFGKKSGLFAGAAVHKIGGDAGDVADYDGQARFGVKFGDGNGFVKVYAARTWTRDAGGATSAPESTDVVLGLGRRW